MIRKCLWILLLVSCLPTMAMNLTSSSWHEFGFIGPNYICTNHGGDNISPQLAWSNVPANTRSFVLFLHDPDASHAAGFVHWVVYIDDARVKSLDTGYTPVAAGPVVFGMNGTDKNAYFGPCAPAGTGLHRYVFTLYALNTQLEAKKVATLDQQDIVNFLYGKVINQATFTGFYRHG